MHSLHKLCERIEGSSYVNFLIVFFLIIVEFKLLTVSFELKEQREKYPKKQFLPFLCTL